MHSITPDSSYKKQPSKRWSIRTCFWTALVTVLLAAFTVIFLMQKPVWVEIETVALVGGALMIIFFTYILFYGIEFTNDEDLTFGGGIGKPLRLADISIIDKFGHFFMAGASEGLVGLLFGLFLDLIFFILFALVLSVLLWLGINLILVGIFLFAVPLFYLFKRSLSFVMKHAEECEGHLLLSLRWGVQYSVIKTLTLCLMVWGAHELSDFIKASFFRI